MGEIILPLGTIANALPRAVALDYWERFAIPGANIQASILGTSVSSTDEALTWNSDGRVIIRRPLPDTDIILDTHLRPFEAADASYRRIAYENSTTRQRLLFGAMRLGTGSHQRVGVFRGGPPFLLSHYLFTEEATVSVPSMTLPADETGAYSGSYEVNGEIDLGYSSMQTDAGFVKGTRLRRGYSIVLGQNPDRDTLLSSGLLFDFFADLTASLDLHIEDAATGEILFRVYRVFPADEITIEWLDASSVQQSTSLSLAVLLPDVPDIAHMLVGISLVNEALIIGADGLFEFETFDFTDTRLDQTTAWRLRIQSIGSTPPQEVRLANLRVWDAAMSLGVGTLPYTVPTTLDDLPLPEFLTDYGYDLSSYSNLPDSSLFGKLKFFVDDGSPLLARDIADLVYHDGSVALPDISGRSRFEIPITDDYFPKLTLNDEQGVRAVNLSVAVDYASLVATIGGGLFSLAAGHPFADAEIRPMYSFDKEVWHDCEPGGSSPTTGLDAGGASPLFTFDWDVRGVVSEDAATVYVTVVAKSASVPEPYFGHPCDALLEVEFDPVVEPPAAVRLNTVPNPVTGDFQADYDLYDRDSALIDITPEYSTDGGRSWTAATEAASGSDGTTDLTSSPSGESHTFVWDAVADGVQYEWVLFRITPSRKPPARRLLYTDFRFKDPLIEQWDFEDPAGAFPTGSTAVPSAKRGNPGNKAVYVDGTPTLDGTPPAAFSGSTYLRLESTPASAAAIAVPSLPLQGLDSLAYGLSIDFRCYLEDSGASVGLDAYSASSPRRLISIRATTTELTVSVAVGRRGEYEMTATISLSTGVWERVQINLLPDGTNGFRLTARIGFATPIIDVTRVRPAAIFDPGTNGVFFVPAQEGAAGEAARVDAIALSDGVYLPDGGFPLPTVEDGTNYAWHPSFPISEDGVFQRIDGSTVGTYTDSGRFGAGGLKLDETTSVLFPEIGRLRFHAFKHGFGVEFFVNIPTALTVRFIDSTVTERAEVVLSKVSGFNRWIVYRTGGGSDALPFPGPGGIFPDDDAWHHVRVSVRRDAPYLMAASLDGMAPRLLTMGAAPSLFDNDHAGFRIQLESGVSPGEQNFFSSLKIWDGYHTSPYAVPASEEPDPDSWDP